jgi:hypothetical protein
MPGVDMGGILAADSYGGVVNKPEFASTTSIPQRASVLKLQFQSYWQNPKDDAGRLQWMRDFYTDLYSGPDADPSHKGTLGTTHNTKAATSTILTLDMLAYPFWPQLYYGEGELFPFLQTVNGVTIQTTSFFITPCRSGLEPFFGIACRARYHRFEQLILQ